MIDAHTHLEQHDYDSDRDSVIEECKKAGVKAIITCCAHPKDWELTKQILAKHKGYVFACAAIHPEYVREMPEEKIQEFIGLLKKESGKILAVGETGLDYNWVKEQEFREKQKELFRKFISFSKELNKPLVIHARDAYEDVLDVLEQEGAKNVMLHMFGANDLVKRVIGNGWSVSLNAIVLRSKKHGKVARDMPLDKLMLETDAPWLHPDGRSRNDSRTIIQVAKKIAEIKKVDVGEVWGQAGRNAVRFFNLPPQIIS
jgi:TatD DNase family protein